MKNIITLSSFILSLSIVFSQQTWNELQNHSTNNNKSQEIVITDNGIIYSLVGNYSGNVGVELFKFVNNTEVSTGQLFNFPNINTISNSKIVADKGIDGHYICLPIATDSLAILKLTSNGILSLFGKAFINQMSIVGSDYKMKVDKINNKIFLFAPTGDLTLMVCNELDLNNINAGVIASTEETVSPLVGAYFDFDITISNSRLTCAFSGNDGLGFNTRLFSRDLSPVSSPWNSYGALGVPSFNSDNVVSLSSSLISDDVHLISRESTSAVNFAAFYKSINAASFVATSQTLPIYSPKLTPVIAKTIGVEKLRCGIFGDIANDSLRIMLDDPISQTLIQEGSAIPVAVNPQLEDIRMDFNTQKNRKVVQFCEVNTPSTIRRFVSNDPPTTITPITPINACLGTTTEIYSDFRMEDLNEDELSFVSITPSLGVTSLNFDPFLNGGTLKGYKLTVSLNANAIAGTAEQITVVITDGFDTITRIFSVIPVALPIPTFNVTSINVCTSDEVVDLYPFVDQPGGYFGFPAAEVFTNGGDLEIDDLDDISGNPSFYQNIEYKVSINGCVGTASIPFNLFVSPTVSLSIIPTICGQNNGEVIAVVLDESNLNISSSVVQNWTTGTTGLGINSLSGLSSGLYVHRIEDGNGCKVLTQFEIPIVDKFLNPASSDVSCFNGNDGKIILSPTTLTSPINYIWSSGQSTQDLINIPAGSYTVTATDATGCVLTETIIVDQADPIDIDLTVFNANCGITDGSAVINGIIGGTPNFTYLWSNNSSGNSISTIGLGNYWISVTDANLCSTTEYFSISEIGAGTITAEVTNPSCGLSNGIINVSFSTPQPLIDEVSWSTGALVEDMINIDQGQYICTLKVNNGCKSIKSWEIGKQKPMKQSICMVTVDSATTSNLVVWEPNIDSSITHWNIYRETATQGEFLKIDSVQVGSLSVFNDVVASPVARSWAYRISAVNECNVESELSATHRTVNINTVYTGTNPFMLWNPYEGIEFFNYVVWRSTDFGVTWQLQATLPSNQLTYTDNTISSTVLGLDYFVEVMLPSPCSAEKARNFNSTRSNRDKGAFSVGEGGEYSNNSIEESFLNNISVYPNPTSETINIRQETNNEIKVKLFNTLGMEVLTTEITNIENQVNLTTLEAGIYIIELSLEGKKRMVRIVKK